MINHAVSVSFNTPIIHVAAAATDETYGAYVAAENNTFNNTNNKLKNSNGNINSRVIVIIIVIVKIRVIILVIKY